MMKRPGRLRFACGLTLAMVTGSGVGRGDDAPAKPEVRWPGMTAAGKVLLPNGWSLRPAGRQSELGDLPVALAENPKTPVLAILHAGYGEHEVWTIDARTSRTLARVAVPASFAGLAWSPDGTRLFVGGGFDDVIYRFDHADGVLSNRATFEYPDRAKVEAAPPAGFGQVREGQRVPAGLAVSSDGETLWVANAFGHSIAKFEAKTGKFLAELPLGAGTFPYGVLLGKGDKTVLVSLWGAARVAVVDAKEPRVLSRIATEEHPNEMLATENGAFVFVANANRNTVSVIDTEKGKSVETINTAIDPRAPSGSTPSSLALSADGSVLFVANANTNDIAAFNVKEPGESTPLGFIPAGWYPTSVRASRDGKTLWVANGKGGASRANREGPKPGTPGGEDKTRQYIGHLYLGTLSTIPIPSPRQMASYSKTVYECSPVKRGEPEAVTGPAAEEGNPIPRKVGDRSPIEYCVYIIKENRTYDQVLGDVPGGNGDPHLCLFPEPITPNHHALAKEFVLLDNFYVDAEVSADGHEWSMGAYATDFVERTWPLGYRGDRRAPYPAEGNFAIATPAGGYLWDRAKAKGVSYRSYGEFVDNGPTPDDPSTTQVESLKGHFDPKFRGYDLAVPDQKRADRFLEELAEFEKTGEMPRLIILRLPNDHTSGSRPGAPTVRAMVADNDLALGRVVEGLSRSKFWPKLAVFVVEDDAQNGSDHVDAHRTIAYAISPYIRKGAVDSTMYSTSSMLRTMELILGLDPMSQFDASARPMSASFATKPDLAPFAARPAGVDLQEKNTPRTPGAEASLRLDLSKEDRADDIAFNEIIWKSIRGGSSPMPPPVRAAFVLPRPATAEKDKDD